LNFWFLELGPLFRKTVADSNAPVQEKALDALIAFLRAVDADAGRSIFFSFCLFLVNFVCVISFHNQD
jgi:hypothetical protein